MYNKFLVEKPSIWINLVLLPGKFFEFHLPMCEPSRLILFDRRTIER